MMLHLFLAACDQGTPPLPAGTINGQVSVEGQGIDGVTVALSTGTSTTTAGEGRFSFTNVDNGTYTVTISNFPVDASFTSTFLPATITTDARMATLNFSGTYIRTASIIGSVTVERTGLGGVTVRLSGMADASTQTDANGLYTFTQLRAGSYKVELSDFAADVDFPTTSRNVTVGVGGAETISFDGTYVRTASIIGSVTVERAGLGGVTVRLSGMAKDSTQTDANGQYAFTQLRAGSYKVELAGFAADVGFPATSRNVTLDVGETEGISFDGTYVRTAGIQGRVAGDGVGLAGVTVNLSGVGPARTATTDAAGQYVFAELRAGVYQVGISGFSADDYEFAETSKSVTVAPGQTANVPFNGTRLPGAWISGQVAVEGIGIGGVVVALSGAAEGTDTTDAQGQYGFSGLAAGTYTVTISEWDADAYIFDVTSRTVVLADDQAAITNFAGAHVATAVQSIAAVRPSIAAVRWWSEDRR